MSRYGGTKFGCKYSNKNSGHRHPCIGGVSGFVTLRQGRAICTGKPGRCYSGTFAAGRKNRDFVLVGTPYIRIMMEEFAKILGICIISAVLCLLLKNGAAQFSTLVSVFVSVSVVGVCVAYFVPFWNVFYELTKGTAFAPYISLLLKVCGIGLLTRVSAEICRDAGEASIAAKAELAGKTAVLVCALPVIKSLFEQIKGFVN